VTQAGGAVGFLQPITTGEIEPVADEMLRALESGTQHLVVASGNGKLLGWFVLETNAMPLVSHWAWFKRLDRLVNRITLTISTMDKRRMIHPRYR
jgi:hypothetical protein